METLAGPTKKYTVLYVGHNEDRNQITIFAPTLNYLFSDMPLTGNFSKAFASNVSNSNNTIEGNISKGSIDVTIYKANSDSTYNLVAKLSKR